ncbi:MAG: hypothetical protein AAB390_03730 [Patescibacteria group bacterium]
MNKNGIIAGITIIVNFLFASIAKADKYGIDQTATDAGLPMTASLPGALSDVLAVAMSMISVVFFIIVLYAGIRWMVARGDEDKAEKSKETIIGAVIGIVIIMLSYALTTFVFKGATGGTILPVADTDNNGKFCVMSDKPTVCTEINGDSKNCLPSIPISPTEAECTSALNVVPPSGEEGPPILPKKCMPSRSQGSFDEILQLTLCDYVVKDSLPITIENDCSNGKTDDGFQLCQYNFNGFNGKHCLISAGVDFKAVCNPLDENACKGAFDTGYVYSLKSSQYGSIANACKWE